MTPQIVLDLSLDGITILSRAEGRKWWREGVVRLDDPDMGKAMARMRARCAARVGEDFTSILIIPDSQLLFTSLERDDRDPTSTIRSLLRGRTPYEVEDLSFDFLERGDRLQVAVVARETLLEAEEFASGFNFRPVALIGNPSDPTYPGLPEFGLTNLGRSLFGRGGVDLGISHRFKVVPAPNDPKPAPAKGPANTSDKTPDKAPEKAAKPATGKPAPDPSAPKGKPKAPAAPTPAKPPQPAPPVPAAKPAAPPPPRPRDEAKAAAAPPVAFSTRRAADKPVPPVAGVTSDMDPRITPQLGAAGARPNAPDTPAPGVTTTPLAGAARTSAATGLAASMTAPRALLTGMSKAMGGLKSRVRPNGLPVSKILPPPAPVDEEAVALTLPGLKRDKAVQPRRTGGGARLGLYLTLSLLALMGLIAVWSVLGADEEEAAGLSAADPVEEASIPLLPPVDPAPSDRPIILETARTPDPAATPEEEPDPTTPADEDVASLLPEPLLLPADPAPSLPSEPATVQPPVPLEQPETPEPQVSEETDGEESPSEGALTDPVTEADPEIEIATTPDPLETDPPAGSDAADAQPALPDAPEPQSSDDVIIAGIDPERTDGDAVALPPADVPTDTLAPQTLPAPAGTEFDTTDEGLVEPSADGTLAPGGYLVVTGRPDVMPTQRSDRGESGAVQTEAETEAERAAREALRRVRPIERPTDAALRLERLEFNGLTRDEMARARPRQRPAAVEAAAARAEAEDDAQTAAVNAATAAAAASLANSDEAEAEGEAVDAGPVSPLALAASDRPRTRPRSVEREAARIVTSRREQASAASSAASAAPAPAAPRSGQTIRSAGGSVARAATQPNAIRLREINLIGVYGKPNARRALVRLSNGRYVKVEVGDRLDRGRVTAIGDSQLVYQRSGRNVTLRMPQA